MSRHAGCCECDRFLDGREPLIEALRGLHSLFVSLHPHLPIILVRLIICTQISIIPYTLNSPKYSPL